MYYPAAKLRSIPAERAPEAPARGWSGWGLTVRTQGTAAVHIPTPAGPGRATLWPSLGYGPYCRLTAKGRDLTSFLRNLDKTAKCHQNVSKRPPLVPILQNGSVKSPLEILRFLF